MSNVLVTGAAGFVGSALARALLDDGERVVSMTRDRTRDPPGTDAVYGDVLDAAFLKRVIADYTIDVIYHLAAQSIVKVCAEDPVNAIDIAAGGTARLLQAVREAGRPIRVIVSTSDKVYGKAPSPYTEESPLLAEHAYEVSKACQDLVARMFASNFDVDVIVARAVNIYGPGDPNDSRVLPGNIIRCLNGQPPIIHAGAGLMRRQYVYIYDLVYALRYLVKHGTAGDAYVVGSPDAPMTVAEVLMRVAEFCGFRGVAEEADRDPRFREIQEQSVDDSKIRELGWEPRVTFNVGLRRTIDWYRHRLGRQV